MPIFEFKCNDCEKIFEEIVFREEDEKDIKCPECGSSDVKKLLSAGAIRPEGIPTGKGGFSAPSCGGCSAGKPGCSC